jgi:signal transduction histidine kinase
VVGVAVLGASAWLINSQRSSLTSGLQSTALLRAQDLSSAIQDGTIPTDLAVQFEDSSFVQVINSNGAVVASSLNISGELSLASKIPVSETVAFYTRSDLPAGDSDFLVVGLRVQSTAGGFTIFSGVSLEPAIDGSGSLRNSLLIVMPILLLLVGAFTWIAVGMAFRPVEDITRMVSEITAEDLHRRVPQPNSDDEISYLAKTMNNMLERLENSDQQQRAFIGDVSHELRSPLAGMQAQLEVHQLHPDADLTSQVVSEVLEEVTRMNHLINDMLLLATVEKQRVQTSYEYVSLNEIVLDEVKKIERKSILKINFSNIHAAQVIGSERQLARLLRNLLENAVRFAEANIRVSLIQTDVGVQLRIDDDGPGIPMAQRESVFHRFTRLDESRTRSDGGVGLGLAIVRKIADIHGATVHIEDNHPGAAFIVNLKNAEDFRAPHLTS